MIDMLPIQGSELVPLTTRLLPKELSHAFGIADDTYDSNAEHAPGRAAAAPAPVITSVAITNAQAGSNVAAAQQKRSAPEAIPRQPAAVMPAQTATAAASKGHYTAVTQGLAVSTPQPAPVHPSSVMQGPSVSQQQATSSIGAGLQQQPALQATAAVVGGQLRGFPAAYISSHPLLPYGQQAVAALPHLSGALPVAMYSPADISAVMALQQQQQQQQQQQHDEAAEDLQARALKRPRLVWTPQLHKLFEEAVQKIGVNKAVPKTIMQMMNIEGLTRENVASHLQKYRLSLKKGPDGEFITTVTEGTETSAADGAGSAGGTVGAAAAAAAAATADAAMTAGNNTSSEAAGDSVGAAAAGAAAAAGGGERSDAGTGAVAGSRGDAGTEAGSNPSAAGGPAGGGGGGTGPVAQEPKTAAAVAAATEALAAAAAAEGLGPNQAAAGDAGQAAGAAAGGPAAAADS